jgi:ketosteroid isomerase-like protein
MKITASLAISIAILVIAVTRVSYAEGNSELLACDYADDAVFVMPATVTRGRKNIQAAFASFFALAGGNIQVTTNSSTIADDVALLEYAVTSSHVTVSDGVDSFVIDNGLIVAQTAHLGGLAIQ